VEPLYNYDDDDDDNDVEEEIINPSVALLSTHKKNLTWNPRSDKRF
jgi:hypothetical protein